MNFKDAETKTNFDQIFKDKKHTFNIALVKWCHIRHGWEHDNNHNQSTTSIHGN